MRLSAMATRSVPSAANDNAPPSADGFEHRGSQRSVRSGP